MYTRAGLLDIHERTQRGLAGLIDHCAGFSEEELHRELEGFGYPTIALQLHHMVGAERYWVGVLRDEILTDEHEADYASIDALRAYREGVLASTREYFDAQSDEDVNRTRTCTNWLGKEVQISPVYVMLRTQTHVFQHKGQVAAMARLLGRPIPAGLDFPMEPASA